ncbi:MAG: cold shock domain-containing protein [Leptolyngbyaceae cyanobacterium]
MADVLQSGKLVTWKDEQGFGFIQPAQGQQDVFVHISAIKDRTRRPQVGDTICDYAVV